MPDYPKTIFEKACLECSRRFIPGRVWQHFCGKDCRTRWSLRKRAYEEAGKKAPR
jgi:hypothetical protein